MIDMQLDQGGLEILSTRECRALLAAGYIGRIVFTDRALPAVQPVNYALLDGDVIIRVGASSRLAVAAHDAIVAFEVDEFDPDTRTGWSVVAVGHAERVAPESEELARLRALPLHPWAPGVRDDYLRIRYEMLTGRRIPGPSDTRSRPAPG